MVYFKKGLVLGALLAVFMAFPGVSEAQEVGPGSPPENTFTLYRNSTIVPNAKLYIATFDSKEGIDARTYNWENCTRAKEAYEKHPDYLGSQLFCENGYYDRRDNTKSLIGKKTPPKTQELSFGEHLSGLASISGKAISQHKWSLLFVFAFMFAINIGLFGRRK